jgi:hypothetical protein
MLASEIYGIVARIDIVYAISSILKLITTQLEFPDIVIIVCINLYSFYKYLVKLGTMKEKRLMIDIIVFRESYKRRELFEIR